MPLVLSGCKTCTSSNVLIIWLSPPCMRSGLRLILYLILHGDTCVRMRLAVHQSAIYSKVSISSWSDNCKHLYVSKWNLTTSVTLLFRVFDCAKLKGKNKLVFEPFYFARLKSPPDCMWPRKSPISHLTICLFHKTCHRLKFTYFTRKSYLFHTSFHTFYPKLLRASLVKAKWKMHQTTLLHTYFRYYHLTTHTFCKQSMKCTDAINFNAYLT